MAGSTVQRNAGPTVALAVTASAHTAVLIDDNTNDQVNYTSFLNAGSKPCAIKWGTTSTIAANPVFPSDGTNGDFVLPGGMTTPLILATPSTPYYLTAICGGTDTTTLYVTPAADQS
jgi:hypothetical protein